MSEVAIKIYDAKREVFRFHLAEAVDGSKGVEQMGKWVVTETGEPFLGYTYARIGHYSFETTVVGTQVDDREGPWPGLHKDEYEASNREAEYTDGTLCSFVSKVFVAKPNVFSPISTFRELKPTTIIEHYYCVIRFLDD